MGGKRTRVRHAFDDGGRLSTACRRIVAKIPFLHVKEQEEEEDWDSLNLCRRCKKMDLDGIFNGPIPSKDSEMVLSLGTLDKESPCPLCRFFYSMRRPSLTGETTDSYHLRKYRFDEYFSEEECKGSTSWAVEQDGSPDFFYDLGPKVHLAHDMLRLWFLPQSSSSDYFEPMGPRPYSKPMMKGLPVNETSVNYPLLRGWINECEDHPNCNYRSSDPTRSHNRPTIRGINCTTRKIVDLQPGDKYIALSYVWGNKPLPENKGNPSNLHSSQRALPTIAPKVVEDAMIVVKELGQQYLWVDQYCIDQHNEQDKHAQIRNMDHIYEESHATIVAFSGDDSSSGLPGVSNTPRIPQPRFTSSKVTLLGFMPTTTRKSVEASTWMKRGWTFQEALLSRRLLIFAQEQVYFHCSSGAWVESSTPQPCMLFECEIRPPLTYSGYSGLHSMISKIVPLKRSRHSSSGFQVNMGVPKLLELIQVYGGRQLSFQADALDAFRGLLSRVSILTYWGVPCYELPRSAQTLNDETYHGLALQASTKKATSLFLRCLLWKPLRAGRGAEYMYLGRREGFPSWSWLSWRTPVAFELRYYNPNSRTHSTLKIEDDSGAPLSILDLIELLGTEIEHSRVLPERTTYLWLEGLVLTLGFQPDSRHPGEFRFCYNHQLGYSDHPCEMRDSCGQPRYGQVYPDYETIVIFRLDVEGSRDISKRTLKRKWGCLLIFSVEYDKMRTYHFLILDEGEDATYCVGTLRLADTADGSMLENLKTQVPCSQRKVRLG